MDSTIRDILTFFPEKVLLPKINVTFYTIIDSLLKKINNLTIIIIIIIVSIFNGTLCTIMYTYCYITRAHYTI